MRFLLDTNIIISMLKPTDRRVISAIRRYPVEDVVTSSVVIHELFFGAFQSTKQSASVAAIDDLRLPVLTIDREDARVAAKVRARLRAAGTPIGPYDVLIAGQALRHGLTLVTANLREFERVPELVCEDWSSEDADRG